jgi:hypothetical protein
MKKILLTVLSLALFTVAFAQKTLPEVKKGTTLNCSGYLNGQEFPLTLSVKSMASPVSIGWAVDGYGEGSFDMSDKALESAGKMASVSQPSQGATKLAEDETFGLISKSAYKSLAETKGFTYNGIKFKTKATPKVLKIEGKELDATHVASEDGKVEIWILNNPTFPLVVQSSGMSVDIVLNSIK